ncbi:lysosome-associated membrane glycoprotein 2 isoform X2 [Rhinatrema bivittatum]|uniref:lysosome-associated membrane glycoprotein 2 isoform X2 n=1 Tax=Rhinatrema bivittatum TaxID=194408 RepID=UPI00112954D8|nr:lysosome-associated membrane glycoprotein 2 isoform X2 [Rhinatrema bivittatum]
MRRCVGLALLCLLGLGFLQSRALQVDVKDDANKTCIYASMMMNFTVRYDTNTSGSRNKTFSLPSDVTLDGSSCGNSTVAPLLWLHFGSGHSWSLNFTRNATVYKGSAITFTYNLNDSHVFPDAKTKGTVTTVFKAAFPPPVPLHNIYKCNSVDAVMAEEVIQIFWNVTLQAFVENGTISSNASQCEADTPSTPGPVTTIPTTTIYSPTTAPRPDKPIAGNYSISNGSKVCLLATMGLQLNVSQARSEENQCDIFYIDHFKSWFNETTWVVINIDPSNTNGTGSCDNDTASLRLNSNNTFLSFLFAVKNNHFYLKEVEISLLGFINGSAFNESNGNLSYWETSLGSSYMCHSEQRLQVTEHFLLNTFDLRVQPFHVENGNYSTADECFADFDLSFLIPMAVGIALGFLILLVFVSYLIGRKKSHTGYQSV